MSKRIIAAALVLLLALAAFGVSFIISKNREEVRLLEAQTNAPTPSESKTEPATFDVTEPSSEDEPEDEPTEEPTEETTYVISDDTELPVPEIINMPTDENWSLVLINKFYQMNDTYEPVLSKISETESIYLDQRVTEAYLKMAEAAKADGITLTAAAGYVAPDRQTRLFEKEVASLMREGYTEEQAAAKAAFSVLPSMCSEANYGLSVDIGWLEQDFADSEAYKWLVKHAANYGFIERYTKQGERITHFNACPWHWRYVGVDYAKDIQEIGVTLEEYVGKVH